MEWLDESEKSLDSEVEIANEPDKIKTQLAQHKVINHCSILVYWENNKSQTLHPYSCLKVWPKF